MESHSSRHVYLYTLLQCLPIHSQIPISQAICYGAITHEAVSTAFIPCHPNQPFSMCYLSLPDSVGNPSDIQTTFSDMKGISCITTDIFRGAQSCNRWKNEWQGIKGWNDPLAGRVRRRGAKSRGYKMMKWLWYLYLQTELFKYSESSGLTLKMSKGSSILWNESTVFYPKCSRLRREKILTKIVLSWIWQAPEACIYWVSSDFKVDWDVCSSGGMPESRAESMITR